ncbi:MAG: tetratricopeptide repeat protein [Methanotrichaceae archaeon]
MAVTSSGGNSLKKAISLLSNGGLDGAMMVVERELESNPDNWEAWAAKADILYLQGMHRSALKCSEVALKFNSENALAWNTKGNALYKLSRYDEAIYCYSRAIEIEPLFVRAWHNKKLAVEMQLKRSKPKIIYLPALESSTRPHFGNR